MDNTFRVLEVARAVADKVNRLLRDPRLSLIHRSQLRDSVQSIAANIREGKGRDIGPDRNNFYRFARASAGETDEHLRANFADERISARVFWALHNRLQLIVKMLDAVMSS